MAIIGAPGNATGTEFDDFILGGLSTRSNTIRGGFGDDFISGDFDAYLTPGGSALAAPVMTLNLDVWSTAENPDVANATTVPHTSSVVQPDASLDWFAFDLAPGQVLTFDLDYGDHPIGVSTRDLRLDLISADGTALIATSDVSPVTFGGLGSLSMNDPFLAYTAETAGRYFVRVSRDTGGAPDGTYVASISLTGQGVTNSSPFIGGDLLSGDAGNDVIYGIGGNDTIFGGDGDDLITGDAGNDTLTGGAGFDTLIGGAGNDLYIVQGQEDVLIERSGAGQGGLDILRSSSGHALENGVAIERLTTTDGFSTEPIRLRGNLFAQHVIGNNGVNVLSDGGGAADTLSGRGGDDQLVANNSATRIDEVAGGGIDTVAVRVDFRLAADDHVERLVVAERGSLGDFQLAGNAFSQVIVGNAGDNTLATGGGAADILSGGAGNDTYVVSNAFDRIDEAAAQGTRDIVFANTTFALAADDAVEFMLVDPRFPNRPVGLTGNGFSQSIGGNAQANQLGDGGGGGADLLGGGLGSDTYVVRNSGTRIVEEPGAGFDRLLAGVSFSLAGDDDIEVLATNVTAGVGAINLTGNAIGQRLVGNDGANRLDARGGADVMRGNGGADTFAFITPLVPGNVDQIEDYDVAADRIEIDNAVFAGLVAGPLAPGAFAANAAGLARDASDRIVYETDTGVLWFDPDGSDGEARVRFAVLAPGLAMTVGEFLVI